MIKIALKNLLKLLKTVKMVNLLVFLGKKNIQVHLWMHGEQNLIKKTLIMYVVFIFYILNRVFIINIIVSFYII